MWVISYVKCMVRKHLWIGSNYRYCVRCGKLELDARF